MVRQRDYNPNCVQVANQIIGVPKSREHQMGGDFSTNGPSESKAWPNGSIPFEPWAQWLLGQVESRSPAPLLGIGSLDGTGKSKFFRWCADEQPHNSQNISYSYWNLEYQVPHTISDVWKSLNEYLEDGLSSALKEGESMLMDTALSSSKHMIDRSQWIANKEMPLRVLIIDEWENGVRAVNKDVGLLITELVLSIERLMSEKCGLGVILVTRFTSGSDLRDWARRHAEEPGGAALTRISGLLERTLKGVIRFPFMTLDATIKFAGASPPLRKGTNKVDLAREIAVWSGGWLSPLSAALENASGIDYAAGLEKANSELMRTTLDTLKNDHSLETTKAYPKRGLYRKAFSSIQLDNNRFGFPLDDSGLKVAAILQQLTEPTTYLAVDGENILMPFMKEWVVGSAVLNLINVAFPGNQVDGPGISAVSDTLGITEKDTQYFLNNRDRYSEDGWRADMEPLRRIIEDIATDHGVAQRNVVVFGAARTRIRSALGPPGEWTYRSPRPEAKAGMDDYEGTAWMVETSLRDPFGKLYVLSDDLDWAFAAEKASRSTPTVLRCFRGVDGNTRPGENKGYFTVEGEVLSNKGLRHPKNIPELSVDKAQRSAAHRPWEV